MEDALLDDAKQIADEMRSWRRHLHAHPELSGQEEESARFIANELRQMGLTPIERVGGTFGLTADVRVGTNAGVGLRADFDALPIQEEPGLDFASTVPGVMHACGHDAHVAMLLGAARLLCKHKDRLTRSVRLIFQPHEERYPGGAPAMIAGGAIDGLEAVFGLHVCTELQTGELGTRPGPFMAAVNPFRIVVSGRGGHAAKPEGCVDPVVAAAHVVMALQTVVSRSVAPAEPAVVSVTQINAGTADNVIANDAALVGTIRTYGEEIRTLVCNRVRELAEGVAAAHLATAQVEISSGYPVLVNDGDLIERVVEAAAAIGFERGRLLTLPLQGVGEDFAYYCQQVPGALVFLGAGNEAKGCSFSHHHPRFNIDEDVLPWGAALHARFALTTGTE
jgi:amidohydrolase